MQALINPKRQNFKNTISPETRESLEDVSAATANVEKFHSSFCRTLLRLEEDCVFSFAFGTGLV